MTPGESASGSGGSWRSHPEITTSPRRGEPRGDRAVAEVASEAEDLEAGSLLPSSVTSYYVAAAVVDDHDLGLAVEPVADARSTAVQLREVLLLVEDRELLTNE